MGLGSDHSPWFPEFALPSDPTNHTLTGTGHSDTGLGAAARLENYTTSAVPVHNQPAPEPANSSALRWVGAFIAVLGVAAAAAYYFMIFKPKQADAAALAQLLASQSTAQSTVNSAVTVASAPTSVAKRTDGALSVDSLPVDDSSTSSNVGAATNGKSKKGKKASGEKGSNESEGEQTNPGGAAEPAKPAPAEDKPAEEAPAEKPAAGIDHGAANAALASAAAAARACRSYGAPPSPKGRAAVTFSPDGSVAAVSISQNYIGTPIGNCVMGHYKNARVPSYSGDTTTLFGAFDMSD